MTKELILNILAGLFGAYLIGGLLFVLFTNLWFAGAVATMLFVAWVVVELR